MVGGGGGGGEQELKKLELYKGKGRVAGTPARTASSQ